MPMPAKSKIVAAPRHPCAPAWLLCLFLLAGCTNPRSILNPQGPAAARIADLWWLIFGLGMVVFFVVVAFLGFALFRQRNLPTSDQPETRPSPGGARFVVWAGIVAPAIILLLLFAFSVNTMRALSAPDAAQELTIQVIGHQWWWEVHYLDQQIETANEIHIPVGVPVQIKLSAQDVVHNFWIPNLHGKLDMIPGQTTTMWIQADRAGAFWGECAEFCGIQHAKMAFVVVAEPPEQFAAWLEQQRQPAATPVEPLAQQGEQVFLASTCVNCHAIGGTSATGQLGPDLTHLASRRTLAAGTLANNRGNLGGWITAPQQIKPGNHMPPTDLTGPDLQALLAYLATLE